jgi:hypothetical protein
MFPTTKKAIEYRNWLALEEDEDLDVNKFSVDDANAAVLKV